MPKQKDEFPEFGAVRRFWRALSKTTLTNQQKQHVLETLQVKLHEVAGDVPVTDLEGFA